MSPNLNSGAQLIGIEAQGGVCHAPIVKTLLWQDEAGTRQFAQTLAAQPGLRDSYLELQGELGAGKTTLVRHLLQALGVTGRVKSPTYAVVEPYEVGTTAHGGAPLRIWHFDFYRFADPREWADAGFRDLFASSGLKLAEWPDKARDFLPTADLEIGIDVLPDDRREVRLSARTRIGAALLAPWTA